MKLDTDQFMDIVLNTSDDFEISIDFSLPTYPIIQLVVCRKKGFIELTQLIGIKVKIHLNSFDDTADFITWMDSLCSSVHQAGHEVICHSTVETTIQEIDLQRWSAFVKVHPMLDRDLHTMVGVLFAEGERAHQFLYDIVLYICKLRISGFEAIRISQVHRMIANKYECSLGSITSNVISPLRQAGLLDDPAVQPYLYGKKVFQVCRVYGVLASTLLGGAPLTLCKGSSSYHFDHGCPLN
jgi:hypothetical protein